ncbi:MAG: DinB family protein [Actinomycetota bacterium]|nr:DinB family protein [Actinomycetota bacterium]
MSAVSIDAERTTLLSHLTAQRNHVLDTVDGLTDDELRRPLLPSGWTCLGLIRHLTLDGERFWFRGPVAADPVVIEAVENGPDDGWQVAASVPADAVLEEYRQEIERSNEIVAGTALDSPPSWWPASLFDGWRVDNLREIILHMIAETACHAGHLDAARELLDGRQWLVLTG